MSETEVTTESQSVDTDNLDAFATEFFGEKKVAVTPAKEEAEQEEVAEETQETEAQTAELTEEDEAAAEEEIAQEKPKSKVQARIDELVKQREDQKRDFEAKFAALEAKLAEKPVEKVAAKAAEPSPEDVLEDGTAKYALGEFDPAYIRDLTRYTLNEERTQANVQAANEARQREENVKISELTTAWNGKIEAAKATYPDLVEKGNALLEGFNNLDQGYAGYLSTVLMSMDHGPDVLYYLSSNPEEARTIVNSGAQRATLALGRIEAKFIEAAAQKLVAKPKISKAPPPPSATARGTGGGSHSVEPDTDDLDAFTTEFFRKRK